MKDKIMKKLKWFTPEKISILLIAIGFVILVTTSFLFLCNFGHRTTRIDSEKLDHFGSFISGLVGSLWSLASFILLYVSLQKQKDEAKKTEIALEEQSKTQQLQQFETTFFNLLKYYNEVVDFSEYRVFHCAEFSSYKGKDAFQHSLQFSEPHVHIDPDDEINILMHTVPITKEQFEYDKSLFFDRYYNTFIPYFKYIKSVFKFMYEANINEEHKIFYIDLFVQRLDEAELKWIIFHCSKDSSLKETISKISIFNESFKQFPLYDVIFGTSTSS